MHSEICPVCGGSGKVKLDGTKWSEGKDQVKTCHGCDGDGWVEVQDSVYPPFIPCPLPAPVCPWPGIADPYQPLRDGVSDGTVWECKEVIQKDFPQWTFTVWN